MARKQSTQSVSIYFYAGDFVDVLRRHAASEQQVYATHNEVAKLILALRADGVAVTIYSFVTKVAKDEHPMEGVRIVSLGAKGNERGILKRAIKDDKSDNIIAHFAYPELITAAIKSKKPVYAGLANSYNQLGPKQFIRKLRIARLLSHPRITIVSNHCTPATSHLADIGVKHDKLVAWDVPHRYSPKEYSVKPLFSKEMYEIAYAGSITELKGVGDLVKATAQLKDRGIQVRLSLAGSGDVEGMSKLAADLNIADRITFRGLIGNDDVFSMFRNADIVAVPSRFDYPEGFPLTMFEAIASRSPIVCSDHPMFRSVMLDGTNCASFESGDEVGCADAIRRVLTDGALYEQLSHSAEDTWSRLSGPADWRTLLFKWVTEGDESSWIREHKLFHVP